MNEIKNTGDDWRHSAACLDEDPELFFPIGETSASDRAQIVDAKAVCGRCAVKATCLEWALNTGQDFGVWGGMTETERRTIKRRKTRQTPIAY